eukprot:jgi/Orpsp1_1/1189424/evm.model.d7180000071954.1
MSVFSNTIINTSTFYGKSLIVSSSKLFYSNNLLNSNKLKYKNNLCTLPIIKNNQFLNNVINNKNNALPNSNYTNNYFRNLNQVQTYSTSCNNIFLNDIFKKKDKHTVKNILKNIKPTINNVINNLTKTISFDNSEKITTTAMKWSGNVNNGFILLDDDEINIQQLSNLFHGFFIYNKNNKRNRGQTNYYYNKDPYHSKKYNNRNKNKKKKRKRLIFKNFHLNNRNVFFTLFGLNLIVFAAWQYAIEQAQVYKNYTYYRFMEDNFCVSWDKVVKRKHWWTLLTSAFSHQEKMHFIMNMLVFNSFAEPVIRALGPGNFLALYLFTGVCSSLSHITFNHFLLPKMNKESPEESFFDFFIPQHHKAVYDNISSLGASGAIMGINTLFACLYPHSIIQYGLFLPLPAWLGMSLYTIMDIYRTATMTNGRIDTAGHVGG